MVRFHISNRKFTKKPIILAAILLFALCGVWALTRSQAAVPTITLEPETATLANGASLVNDAAASSSKAVKFATKTTAEKFTIVIIPDTQITIAQWKADFQAQIDWIKNNAISQNIRYVYHVGDIQEWPANTTYYPIARDGMSQLDGRVPYIIAIGNHDFDQWSNGTHTAIAADRSTTLFNQYFPASKFKAWPTYGGGYPANSNDNAYHMFSAGGTDWLVLTLKYRPTAAELAWANTVIAAHPTRRAMIVTHEYMSGNGVRTATGENIWNTVAKKHKNVQFVFAGHINPGARRIDAGDNGNQVFQLLSDYQNYNVREPNSYIRIMNFDPVAGTVAVKTYSPAFNKFMTGGTNEFVLSGVPFGPIQ